MPDSNSQKIRVLVVDDEPVVADTLATILRINGYRADAVHSPSEALERASTEPFDLLLTDVVMEPEMSGIDLAIEICASHPHCKVLLISGNLATSELLSKAREKGYDFEILPKPIHPVEILERLKAMTL